MKGSLKVIWYVVCSERQCVEGQVLISATLSYYVLLSLSRSETRPPEDDEEEEEEILGSDDDEQEDPKDYVKGKKSKSQAKIGDGNLQSPF